MTLIRGVHPRAGGGAAQAGRQSNDAGFAVHPRAGGGACYTHCGRAKILGSIPRAGGGAFVPGVKPCGFCGSIPARAGKPLVLKHLINLTMSNSH